LVDEIAKRRMERDFYTFQMVTFSIRQAFPDEANELILDLVRMLAFDALVGNNDRHPANWGFISSVKANIPVLFSPIFDTARGLFWNDSEATVKKRLHDRQSLEAYVRRSLPQIGWEGEDNLNHIELTQRVGASAPEWRDAIKKVYSSFDADKCARMLDGEFGRLLSSKRILLIDKCLRLRHQLLVEAVG
jgi:hypothetical protein